MNSPQTPFDIRPRAELYIKNHLDVVPVEPRSKVIRIPGWQNAQFSVSDFSPGNNVGLRLGRNGLADVDLDCDEARTIADMFLPETGFIFGRSSARASHYFYFLDPPTISIKLMDPIIGQEKGGTIAELRCLKTDGSIGFQTVAPGSIHEGTGERIEFESGSSGIPQNVDSIEVIRALRKIGASCLLARYFPAEGMGRNDTLLAIAGILARNGWTLDEADLFNFSIYRLLWGSKASRSACTSEVKPTFSKLASGSTIYGIPKLKELIDGRAVDRALEWLGIDRKYVETPRQAAMNGHHAPAPKPQDSDEPDEKPIEYTPWPRPLSVAAFHGPIGDLCKIIEPNTESDISAVLFQALVMVGSVFGRGAHFTAEATPHFCNEFVCIVGATAKGRKGSSFGQVKRVLGQIDQEWSRFRVKSGLSSGEGLIFHVRDEIREMKKVKGVVTEVITDAGEKDKRMLVVEEELSGAFKAMCREGNNLSGVLRQAWDSPMVLAPMTKNNRITASFPHVSVIGHITKDELLKSLKSVENTNGCTNRFLWCCAKRSKLLPFGGNSAGEALARVANTIDCAVGWAQNLKEEIQFNGEAAEMWSIMYEELGDIPSGTIGAILSRAEPHVRRVATIYAALDQSIYVRPEHLEAALEVWRYSVDSVKWIFDSSEKAEGQQNKIQDKILKTIKESVAGSSRSEIGAVLGGGVKKTEVEFHLSALLNLGKIVCQTEKRTRKKCEFYYIPGQNSPIFEKLESLNV